ncbi:crotonase/enoyl-CoA hydratase family protein [Moraxella sp. K127]|uniref:crotonase/enoyl-CoA hydratase family protein n=1 Tax=Moraxella TaxID=475 RepID=UPI001880248D|nr:crotonase/enoyl-CoA hydratase family protein [Moraxella sp. K127]MBE9591451.1 crotonase/enoyl-CoA hydratase family protein [Moraxella sp. K127]
MQTLTLSHDNHIAIITLSRPHKKNAMNFVMMQELIKTARHIKADKSVRAVIITGGADFCSGLDLAVFGSPKNMIFATKELIKPAPSLFQKVCLIWQSLPVPVIAVVDGVCLGAGLQLAMGADVRISHPSATWSVLEAKWGLVADMGLTRLARDIGKDKLKELAMSARLLDAQTAYDYGLITHLDDEPMARAKALADEIASRSPDAVLASKRLINRMHPSDHLTLYQEKLWQLKLFASHNRKLAIKKAKDTAVAFRDRQWG